MEHLTRDVRFALRNLRSSPAFAVVATLTIALGIGATTSIFSVVNGVLLRDLPYDHPDRLVRIWSTNPERGIDRGFMSPPDIADYTAQNRTLDDIAAYAEAELAMIEPDGGAVKVTGTWAGGNLFSVLGVPAYRGRTLVPEDGAPGAPKVMVLSYGFWQNRLGGRDDVLGTSITVEEEPYDVVGVMPPGFAFPGGSSFWLNRYLLSYPGRYARWMDVVARLADGTDIEAARSDLDGIAARLESEYPDWNRAYRVTVLPLHDAVVGDTRPALFILMGATALLLTIACVNVVNLLLARLADRGRELALRAALGAGRWRLSRQLLTESLVLAGGGAVIGTVLAVVGTSLLTSMAAGSLPRLDRVSVDGSAFLFALGVTVATGLIVGLVPVLRLGRTNVQTELQEGGRSATAGGHRERLRGLLVVTEIALAVTVTVGAGLLARSFARLHATDPGFRAENVLTFQLELPSNAYDELPAVASYYERLTDRLAALPGVESAAATATLPLDRDIPFLGDIALANRPAPPQGQEPEAYYRQVTPGYFRTMGIPIVEGRAFDRRDHGAARGAAIISRSFADRLFPSENPIGQTITGLPPHIALGGFLTDTFDIVGVAEDVRYFGLGSTPRHSLYLPAAQAPFRRMSYTLQTTRDAADLMTAVRAEVSSLDPTVPISRVQTMARIQSASVARERLSVTLLALFAVGALALAAAGVYGVMSYTVSQRRAELGIRMAIGADARDVLKLVLAQGARLTLWGIGVGLAGAAAAGSLLSSQLYGIHVLDPVTFGGVAVILATVALVATYVPATRAARIDPALALHGEGR